MRIITLVTLIFLLSILGGMQAYNPAVTVCIAGAGLVVIALSFFFWGNGPVVSSLWLFSIAMVLSCLANLDIAPVALSRVFLYVVAVSLMAVTGRLVTEKELLYSLILCAGLWLAAELWVRPLDNQNYKAIWAVIFILALWGAGQRGWLSRAEAGLASLPFIVMLLWLGSRGAVLGLAAGAVTFYLPRSRTSLLICSMTGVILLAGLILWRPMTAGYRLLYWQQALETFLANPIVGVGPGGILARQLILEPGTDFHQPHAHNAIISSMAELGSAGLVGLVYAGARLYVQRSTFNIQPWQLLAVVTGLLCHSLVDEPLFWPGPLFLFGMVAGTIRRKTHAL